ncbi:ead/Ea22-like family protein [Klebsiella pneumoniae]|uniref:ead/Ea22-like family protein n=1 Tax=Klebsiella pneumoniae TaxID=573 RepID=UPI000E2CBC3E|nr:ead/Ea22-like family protein [Klebsiella pneumoniae]MDR4855647.1 ead/Ea22-like family protein [Klebsiella pneumoniae]SWP78009.1 RelE family toxin-antitoxin system [Klebsiella pneumoniae]HEB8617908.1 ead/Ea22-like family protein [Klebsiella pneumoniae]
MTDITELAQSLKAAAEKATPGEWRRASTQFNGITATPFMLGRKEVMIAGVSEKCDAEFIAMANPANILVLVEALEYYKSREERVTSLVRDNSKSWDELYRQVEAKGKRNVELVEALESEKRICATWRKTAEANSEKLEKAQQQMTESENRVRKQNRHICELFDDNTALRQRIAELESSTVTVKLASRRLPSDYVDGEFGNDDLAAIHNACRLECKVSVEKYLSAHGIVVKWEDE